MNHNQGGGLPVSATQLNQQMYIQGLPNNIPFQPQVPLSQNAQTFAQEALGIFLQELQDKASKNPARIFLFNFLSRNNYQNNEFNEIFISLTEYIEALVMLKGMPVRQAMQDAASDLCSMMSSIYVLKFQQLQQMLDQNALNAAQGWAQTYNDVRGFIDGYSRQQQPGGGQQQQQGWGGQGQQQNQGFGPSGQQDAWRSGNTQEAWRSGQPQGFGPATGGQGFGGQGQGQGFGGRGQPQGFGPATGGQGFGGGHAMNNSANMFSDGNLNTDSGGGSGRGREFGTSLKPRNAAVKDSFSNYSEAQRSTDNDAWAAEANRHLNDGASGRRGGNQSTSNWGTDPNEENFLAEPFAELPAERLFDRMDTNDGKVATAAHLTDKKKVFTPQHPYSLAFDPTRQVKYIVEDSISGMTYESIIAMEEGMDYLKHEMDPAIRGSVVTPNDGVSVPNWKPVYDKTSKDDLTEAELVEFRDITTVNVPSPVFNNNHAYLQVMKTLIKKGSILPDDTVEYTFTTADVMFELVNPQKVHTYFEDLILIKTVDKYVIHLAKLANDPSFPTHILVKLVKRATDALNTVLSKGMGLDWEIESIIEDWLDLKDLFAERFGEEQCAHLLDVLNSTGSKPIIYSTVLIDGAVRDEFLKGQDFNGTEYENYMENLFVIGDKIQVTTVPYLASDLSISLEEKGSAVLKSHLPELFKGLKGMAERADKQAPVSHIYLVTKDLVELEVNVGILGKDFYILSENK